MKYVAVARSERRRGWRDFLLALVLVLPMLTQADVLRSDLSDKAAGTSIEQGGTIAFGWRQQLEMGSIGLQALLVLFWFSRTGRLPLRGLSGKCALGLCLVFLASTLWSVNPALTFLRSVETFSGMCLCGWLFEDLSERQWLQTFLCLAFGLSLFVFFDKVGSVLLYDPSDPYEWIRDNRGGEIVSCAATAFILSGRLASANVRVIGLILLFGMALVFRSLTSVIAFLSATTAIMSLSVLYPRQLPKLNGMLVHLMIFGVALILVWIVASTQLTDFVADALDRDEEGLRSATGRTTIWYYAWLLATQNPFGLGYVAGERVSLADLLLAENGFGTHAHNMQLSLLLSGGWIALIVAMAFIASAFVRYQKLSRSGARIVCGLVLTEFVCTLSTPGLGSVFGITQIVYTSVSLFPLLKFRE